MTHVELTAVLDRLLADWENEVIKFKEGGDAFSTDRIGEYFSALTNEANLCDAEAGWLVFGVNNKTRRVVGTEYRPEPGGRIEGVGATRSARWQLKSTETGRA